MKAMECSKNQLGVKIMKKGVKMNENGFNSKDNCISTQVLSLKMWELENIYFRKVVDLFESFSLTTHLPASNIGAKGYGQNTKIGHRGAKNPIFGSAAGKIPVVARIWAKTTRYNEKNIAAVPTFWIFFC